MIRKEEDFRLRGYNRDDYNYNTVRYSLTAMKYYSYLRSIKISHLLIRNLSNKQKNDILDVGCGNGLLLSHLTKIDKYNNFTGLDFSENMLKNTVFSEEESARIKLVQGSAFDLPFDDNKFDAVICTRFIHQYSNSLKLDLVNEMKRIVKPNGLLIIEFYSLFPRLLRYPIEFHKISREEYFKHTTTMNELKILMGEKHIRENLVLPHPNLLTKILGINKFKYLSNLFPKIGLSFMIDQFLVCSRK